MTIKPAQIIKLIFIVLFFLNLNNKIVANNKVQDNFYKEQMYIHIGRDAFIAGENIWLKAYCLNISHPELPALSKVAYVELVNEKCEHVLGQILKIEDGSSESCLTIPDTLISGLYYIKSYTQWMQNFGPETFFSLPIYIYNIYDNKTAAQLNTISQANKTEIFIEGSKLIGGISTKVAVSFPGFKGKETSCKVLESGSDSIVSDFKLDISGEGIFDFTPAFGHQYVCSVIDSGHKNYSYQLPEVKESGYKINMINVSDKNIEVLIDKKNTPDQKLKLELWCANKLLSEKIIDSYLLNKKIDLPFNVEHKTFAEVLLKDIEGNVLAMNAIYPGSSVSVDLKSLQKTYNTKEPVNLKLLFNDSTINNSLNVSISIYKKDPLLNAPNLHDIQNLNNGKLYRLCYINNQFDLMLFSANQDGNCTEIGQSKDLDQESLLPVEDMGIIYTGVVINPADKMPVSDLTVIYSLKDSIPDLQSTTTNEDGQFALLVNESGDLPTYINIYNETKPVSDIYKILIDKKFYYQNNSAKVTLQNRSSDSAFISQIQDEAQRVLIQRIFTNKEEDKFSTTGNITRKHLYYSNSVLTVFPDDFVTMPNFEEIAREILPRVQYKRSKDGCSLFIYNSEPVYKSFNPLVLLNGIPVDDKCELFDLNSEMINKIYIQHESRVVGNLYFDGLLSINTYPDKKLRGFKANTVNKMRLSGYVLCNSSDQINMQKTGISKNSLPDFKNQLFWKSITLKNGTDQDIQFITSDEEGEYIVDIQGLFKDGTPISYQNTFTVQSK
jgi:hypothetical protein